MTDNIQEDEPTQEPIKEEPTKPVAAINTSHHEPLLSKKDQEDTSKLIEIKHEI